MNIDINHRVKISVGEPWDFHSSDGENALLGKLVSTGTDSQGIQYLKVAVSPFSVKNVIIDKIYVIGRYREDRDLYQKLDSGHFAAVNMYTEPDSAEPVLVGTIALLE